MSEYLLRHDYSSVRDILKARLEEPAPAKIQLLFGPRQVGKTTLLHELADQWGDRAVYASADAPEAELPGWADTIWRRAVEKAAAGSVVLLLDEVHFLPNWSRWLKAKHDDVVQKKIPLHTVATGSSSLDLGTGSRETMAGRFEKLSLHHWAPADLVRLLGVAEADAPSRWVTCGGYPGACPFWENETRLRAYLRDSIVEPAIGRDILQLEQVRKPALLRQIFALAMAHPTEILSLEKIAGSLAEKGALETISHYLDLLREAYLVAPVPKWSGDEIRRRKSPPKLVALNHGLLLGGTSSSAPGPRTDPSRWGRWVENACLAHAWNAGQQVHYWRAEPWEVDGVIQGNWGRWIVEVKTGRYSTADLKGLAVASSKFPAFSPLVICDPGEEGPAETAGFRAIPWPDYLLRGLEKESFSRSVRGPKAEKKPRDELNR
ncbi:MAG: ATP-binding protein [Verrucomicrobia bacterium]|nr:ATP-binding protein [Verrucomicrobiota bacterium]